MPRTAFMRGREIPRTAFMQRHRGAIMQVYQSDTLCLTIILPQTLYPVIDADGGPTDPTFTLVFMRLGEGYDGNGAFASQSSYSNSLGAHQRALFLVLLTRAFRYHNAQMLWPRNPGTATETCCSRSARTAAYIHGSPPRKID